jgi:bifunctional enzyme CysN/CysC
MEENDLPPASPLAALVDRQTDADLVRFITCGSVDDGKSTLIGRLLYDGGLLLTDEIEALGANTDGETPDFAALLDGLAAEREQGITIDVAYRFFATASRRFIVADTPGHEQYTRNMVTAASTADAAVILVDVRQGVLSQTRRHAMILALCGVRQLVLAVNKMDLVDFGESHFRRVAQDFERLAAQLAGARVTAIPVSARDGDNVVRVSSRMPWYDGPTLLSFLDRLDPTGTASAAPFRFPVQWVNRAGQDFRGYCGTICAGAIRVGETVTVLPGGQRSIVGDIIAPNGPVPSACAGQAVTLCLADQVDVGRGSVLVAGEAPSFIDQVTAHLVWMAEEPMVPGRSYLFRVATQEEIGRVTSLKFQVNVASGESLAARVLPLNGIGCVNLSFDRPMVVEPYGRCRDLGAFIVIDRTTNATVGAGMIDHGLWRAETVGWQPVSVDKQSRARQMGQVPRVLWFTGLSGSGKSTIANRVEARLQDLGCHTYLLDGDNVRHGLNRDLGFTVADRVENVRRLGEVARLMADAGLIVLVSAISPFRADRAMVREMMVPGEFLEIFVATPLAVCESRDPKGLYARARRGEIGNFTGVDSPYEEPENPDLRVDTDICPVDDAAALVLGVLGYGAVPRS